MTKQSINQALAAAIVALSANAAHAAEVTGVLKGGFDFGGET